MPKATIATYKKRTGLILFYIVAVIVLAARVPYIGSYIDDYTFKIFFGFFRYFVYAGLLYFLVLKLLNVTTKPWIKSRCGPIIILLLGASIIAAIIQGPAFYGIDQHNFSQILKEFWNKYYGYITPTAKGYLAQPVSGFFGSFVYAVLQTLPGAWGLVLGYIISPLLLIVGLSAVVTCKPFYLYVWVVSKLVFMFKKWRFERHLNTLSDEEKRKYPFFEKTQTIDIKKAVTQELGLAPTMNKYVPKFLPDYASNNNANLFKHSRMNSGVAENKQSIKRDNLNTSVISPFAKGSANNEEAIKNYEKSLVNSKHTLTSGLSKMKSKFSLFGNHSEKEELTPEQRVLLAKKEAFDDEARVRPHQILDKVDVDEVLKNMNLSDLSINKEFSKKYKYSETAQGSITKDTAENILNKTEEFFQESKLAQEEEKTDEFGLPVPEEVEEQQEASIPNDINDYPKEEESETDELESIMTYKDLPFKQYDLPSISLLHAQEESNLNKEALDLFINLQIQSMVEAFSELSIAAEYSSYILGPSVLRVFFKPLTGFRVKDLTSVSEDIKRSLKSTKIVINATLDGTSHVAIDVPLAKQFKRIVTLRETLGEEPKSKTSSEIEVALGKNLRGESIFLDIEKAPHILVAGATGSGKSVAINAFLLSLLLKFRPNEIRLMIIDPKCVDLAIFGTIPHLLCPIINDATQACLALKQLIKEMNLRYRLLQKSRVKNITAYNASVKEGEKLPRIVVIIDEYADIKVTSSNEIDDIIMRLTQMARAAGIHIIIATQRPSVNIITGSIKVNIPTRIAFAVGSSIDSRTILDESGAENLLGNGDMLYSSQTFMGLQRIQGAYVNDEEISRVIEKVTNDIEQIYDTNYLDLKESSGYVEDSTLSDLENDEVYLKCKSYVLEVRKCSTSLLQTKFKLGYPRAARIVSALEEEGIVGPSQGGKPREVLK